MYKVAQWMTPNPVTIDKDSTIIEAMHLMKEKNIRRLPVMDGSKIAGILTEKMVLDFKPGKSTCLDTWEVHYILAKTPVTAAMNPKPYRVTPDTDLASCAQLIHDRKLNGVLVIDASDNLVGILTTTNALEALIAICKSQTP
jgi:acetoin utilization protein AcuB